MATHSSTLAWKIPWTEEPSGLQSTGSQRVGHNCATSLSFRLPARGGPAPGDMGMVSQLEWHPKMHWTAPCNVG